MMNELKILLSVLLVSILSVLQISCNARKSRRIRQFPLIIISFLFSGIGMFILVRFFSIVVGLFGQVKILTRADLLIANVLLLTGYIAVRLVLRPLITAIFKSNKILQVFSLNIYHYDDEYDEWFLKKQWKNFRGYFLALLWAVVIFSGIYLGFTWVRGPGSPIWMMIFPCAAIAVVNEIYNFLNGQTKEEFMHSILGDEADARRVGNYYKLREILERILPEPLLSAHTGNEYIAVQTPADLIKQLKDSKDSKDRITAEYFDTADRYKTADVDAFQATLKMMHRRNVIFFNPFYRDASMYITLPMVTALLSGKKCVVLCGRKTVDADVKRWVTDVLHKNMHMRSMWRVDDLSNNEPKCEVGILTSKQMYDKHILRANREFFHETDFVLLIEPSVMINTSQVALSILADEMGENEEQPVYCVCDRNTDGLVDTLSHLLRAEITDVVAPPVPRCNYTAMMWNADGDFSRQRLFDKQMKYLGNGIELAAIAIKNQVPKATWYSETKAPVKDIKWIAGQYHSTICRYMNLPTQQKSLYEKIDFVSNLWSSDVTKEQFLIVEDEFCNMFSMMRTYLSRGKNQIFVNILSENYLLRDYMRYNRQMFLSNPNAIPSYVPDYAKTERNTILKLILMMTLMPVREEEVIRELHLAGIETNDVFGTLSQLLQKYTYAEDSIFTVRTIRYMADEFTPVSSCIYRIPDEKFEKYFSDSLKSAYYILEEEKDEENYIDVKMFSHVTQTIMKGQLVTYDGKHYSVEHISPQSGVVLHRASDLFDGRKYYRQIRKYIFDPSSTKEIVSAKSIGDIEFSEVKMDFQVDTSGYLEMDGNHNLRTARIIDLSDDPSICNYKRKYRNKSVLCIKLPESDDKIRFTICLLLSEIFRSVFPDGWQYITAMTKRPEGIEGMLNYMVYQMDGEMDGEYIYIVEDSDIDLGLLSAVEKNFMKLMEILADFLDWHAEKMREPVVEEQTPAKVVVVEEQEKKKKCGWIRRILDRIRRFFGFGKKEPKKVPEPKKDEDDSQQPEDQVPETSVPENVDLGPEEVKVEEVDTEGTEQALDQPEEDNSTPDNEPAHIVEPLAPEGSADESEPERPADEAEPTKTEDPELVHVDGTDIFDPEGMPEDDYLESNFNEMGIAPLTESDYQRECFLKLGFEEIDGRISVDELRKYLRIRGWTDNALTLARTRDSFAKSLLDIEAVNQCDFCHVPLTGVSYERLNDGRIRCNDCSASAISSLEDFKELFYRNLRLMEDYFEIRFKEPIKIKTADARTVAKGVGMVFRPSTRVAARVLGYAQKKRGEFSIVMENGSPRLATINTMVHELTHIWQFRNWNKRRVRSIYRMNDPACTNIACDIVYEGMAVWAALQFLYHIGETYFATQQEIISERRSDIYGIGFRLYAEQYPLVKDSSLVKFSPFLTFPTLEPEEVRMAVRSQCTNERCIC
mgnify:FL=1